MNNHSSPESTMKHNFLLLFCGVFGKTPRPTRFFKILSAFGHVTVCSDTPGNKNTESARFLEIRKTRASLPAKAVRAFNLFLQRYEADIWHSEMLRLFNELKTARFSAIVCHDAVYLPFAEAIRNLPQNRGRCAVVMDAREFYPREFENRFLWRLLHQGLNEYLCRRYLPKPDVVFTVSPGLKRGYEEEYGVSCLVLPSYPDAIALSPRSASAGPIRCIHHGSASPGRKIELMIDAFRHLGGKATLDLMLVPNKQWYYTRLKQYAATTSNVRVIEPVAMPDIVPAISGYDVGVFLLPDNTFNHKHVLPNKIFEYIQARLAIAVSPNPDMADLVKNHSLGVVARDYTPESLAQAIAGLSRESIDQYKANAHAAAQEMCWQSNVALIQKSLLKAISG